VAEAVGRAYRSAMPVLADKAAPCNDETAVEEEEELEGVEVVGTEEEVETDWSKEEVEERDAGWEAVPPDEDDPEER